MLRGGSRGTCCCEGYGFQAVYSGIGYYINKRFMVILQETDQLGEDFSLD